MSKRYVVVTLEQWDQWRRSYLGGSMPFEHAGTIWLATGASYGPLDRFGYSPAPFMWAGEVVVQEEWPELCWETGSAGGARGYVQRIGHATKGKPYVFTGEELIVGTNCGHPTEHSPGGSYEQYDPGDLLG